MEYRVTIKSNPRLLILFGIIAALAAGAILLTILWSPIAGIIALGLVFYIDYHLIKFVRQQLSSYVTTTDEGIRGLSTVSEDIFIAWKDVTHAGVAKESGGRRSAFVYAEESDQLISVPSDYENFDGFVAELRQQVDVMEISLQGYQTVADKLKELILTDIDDEDVIDDEDSD